MSLTGEWSLAVNDCGRYVVRSCLVASADLPSRFLNTMKDNSRFAGTYPTVEAPWYPALGSCAPWAVSGARRVGLSSESDGVRFAGLSKLGR